MSEIVHFAGHTGQAVRPRRRHDLPGASCLVSSADRCSVSSVRERVTCLAWSALVARPGSGTACAAACDVQSVRVRWGWGLHRRGIQEAPGVGWVDILRRKNSKKAFFGVPLANTNPTFTKRNPSDCASLQKFRKKQKSVNNY